MVQMWTDALVSHSLPCYSATVRASRSSSGSPENPSGGPRAFERRQFLLRHPYPLPPVRVVFQLVGHLPFATFSS